MLDQIEKQMGLSIGKKAQGLPLTCFFLRWPARPPKLIPRWPNGSFGGLDAVNVLMSTRIVNPSARIS